MHELNSRVLGAVVLGVALVGGAYLAQNFGTPRDSQPARIFSYSVVDEPMPREAIAVSDANSDGIEDWREEFLSDRPVVRTSGTSSSYTPPDTLTGQVGVQLMERYILSQSSGPLGRDPDEIANQIASGAVAQTREELYTREDITIVRDTTENIRRYGNTLAQALEVNSVETGEHELLLLRRLLQTGDPAAQAKLAALASTTRGYRDDTLPLPVPESLAKPHLDLVNVYNAVYHDMKVFADPDEDPLVTLVHVRRHEDDTRALGIALQNMFDALLPHAAVFERDDPAFLFAELAGRS